jgi:hypothetical protein
MTPTTHSISTTTSHPANEEMVWLTWRSRARLTVLHLDKDFELIADVTGQPQARLPLAAD